MKLRGTNFIQRYIIKKFGDIARSSMCSMLKTRPVGHVLRRHPQNSQHGRNWTLHKCTMAIPQLLVSVWYRILYLCPTTSNLQEATFRTRPMPTLGEGAQQVVDRCTTGEPACGFTTPARDAGFRHYRWLSTRDSKKHYLLVCDLPLQNMYSRNGCIMRSI